MFFQRDTILPVFSFNFKLLTAKWRAPSIKKILCTHTYFDCHIGSYITLLYKQLCKSEIPQASNLLCREGFNLENAQRKTD